MNNFLQNANLRVLFVMKGDKTGCDMVFAKRMIDSSRNYGVMIKPFYLRSLFRIANLFSECIRLKDEISVLKPHIIHSQYGTITAFLCSITSQLPMVVTYRGSDLNPCPSENWFKWATGFMFSQIAAFRADKIICVSRELKNRLWYGKNKVSIIPSGVDTKIFFPKSRNAARSELGWNRSESVVLFNAGTTPIIKRLDLAESAVKAANNFHQRGKVRLFTMNGTVPPALVPTLMNAADCLLVTSDWEGSPTVVQEAMACNLPIVSVDVGDVKERLAEDKVSRIVARDSRQLGKNLSEILEEKERSNGSEVIKDCTYESIIPKIISIYGKLIEK